MDLSKYITSRLDKFRNDVASTIVGGANTALNTKFLPGQKRSVSDVFTTKWIPGQKRTFLEAAGNTWEQPGFMSAGARGVIDSHTLGLHPGKQVDNKTLSEKIGYGIGYGAGFFSPTNPVGKVFGGLAAVGRVPTTAVASKIVPKAIQTATPQLLKTGGKVLAEEIAQSGGYVGAKKLLGQKQDFKEDLLMGVGFRGAFGGAGRVFGKKMPSVSSFRMTKTQTDKLVEAQDMLVNPKRYLKFRYSKAVEKEKIKEITNEATKRINYLAQKYLPTEELMKYGDDFNKLATRLYKLSSENKLGRFELPNMSLVGKNNVGDTPVRPQDALESPRLSKSDTNYQLTKAVIREDQDPATFKKLFSKLVGKLDAARTRGVVSGSKFKAVPAELAPDVIKAIETPEAEVSAQARATAKNLRKEYDTLYSDARNAGLDINYLQNYITHIWQESPQEAATRFQAFKSANPGFKFAKDRTIPTSEEGIKAGLTPKFTQPSRIIAEYTRRLEQAKANLEFFKGLKKAGLVVDAAAARGNPDFVPVQAVGFPQSRAIVDEGKEVIGNYYAPREVAQTIVKVFNPDQGSRLLATTAKISGNLQNLTLSGGIPATPVNAFSMAQLQKETLGGRGLTAFKSFIRSIAPGPSRRYFEKNAQQIIKMQERNIPIQTSFDTDSLGKDPAIKKTLGDRLGKLWEEATSNPTFKRFMPMLQIEMFNKVEKSAINSGKSNVEAADIAAKAVKNFYGVTGSDTQVLRSANRKNLATTFLFAPPYREAMVTFWMNNLKALKNPLVRENRANAVFLLGSAATFAGMNQMNIALNGHPMWENGNGKEDKLLIPTGDGTVIGVPFLSSIGTIPRALLREGSLLVKGDVQGAAKDAFQSYSSMAIKPVADVAINQDYFGKEIVSDTDLPDEKLKKQAGYLGRQYGLAHPYVKELTSPSNQNDPLYQRLSRAAELPFRFYEQGSIDKSKFYDEYYKLKPFAEAYEKLSYQDPAKAQEFLAKNQEKINQFEYMKQVQKAYYNGGATDTSLLANNIKAPAGNGGQTGNYYIYSENGQFKAIDRSKQPVAPKLTGNYNLDKVLLSEYRSDTSSKQRDIRDLYKQGQLSAEEANKQIADLEMKYTKLKGPKTKKLKAAKIKLGKVKIPKPKKIKAKKLKVKKIAVKNVKLRKSV